MEKNFILFIYNYYLTTRPDAEPPINASTSLLVEKLKSPLMECFKQEAATAYLTAILASDNSGVVNAKINPPASGVFLHRLPLQYEAAHNFVHDFIVAVVFLTAPVGLEH